MTFRIFLLMFATLLLAGVSASAEPIDAVKKRMLARVPALNQLKAAGIVGEGKNGYLAFVGAKRQRADLVGAENADRRLVYTHIAKATGATPEIVGKRRAQQIAKIAGVGTFVQRGDGAWKRK